MSDHEHWTHRLTDYLDGDLTPAERAAFEAHADNCRACRRAVDELRAIVADARALGPVEPPRDLWPGIEAALSAAPRERRRDPEVIALPTALPTPSARPRRSGVFLSTAQLAAAAVALMFVSVGLTLGLGFRASAPDGAVPVDAGAVRSVSTAPDPGRDDRLADEVAALEEGLARAGDRLDPNTVRIIQKNLAVIERAIEESRQALAVDPENAFLREHLERTFERKRDYLEEATRIAEWTG